MFIISFSEAGMLRQDNKLTGKYAFPISCQVIYNFAFSCYQLNTSLLAFSFAHFAFSFN